MDAEGKEEQTKARKKREFEFDRSDTASRLSLEVQNLGVKNGFGEELEDSMKW